ncbi:MAG: hypothetical protein IPM24_02485 [Bryobacterales bacterium]|nr:hypothetical protein [Bryobacterales bacterium]
MRSEGGERAAGWTLVVASGVWGALVAYGQHRIPDAAALATVALALPGFLIAHLAGSSRRWRGYAVALLFAGPLFSRLAAHDSISWAAHLFLCAGCGWVLLSQASNSRRELHDEIERLETLCQSRSVQLASLTHEIRTPLSGIIGITTLTLDGPLEHEQREHLEAVRSVSYGMLRTLTSMGDLARIEAGLLETGTEPFHLREIVEESARLFRAELTEKRLGLVSRLDPGIPEVLVGDAARLRQVLVNLMSNAVRYSDAGEIVISAICSRRRPLGITELQVSISDRGPGIALDRREAIFEPFTRARPEDRISGGLGLGLHIVRGLVREMGGRIWVDADPGGGSVFSFTVLVGEPSPEPAAAVAGIVSTKR